VHSAPTEPPVKICPPLENVISSPVVLVVSIYFTTSINIRYRDVENTMPGSINMRSDDSNNAKSTTETMTRH
jgi:hypothetical protein